MAIVRARLEYFWNIQMASTHMSHVRVGSVVSFNSQKSWRYSGNSARLRSRLDMRMGAHVGKRSS